MYCGAIRQQGPSMIILASERSLTFRPCSTGEDQRNIWRFRVSSEPSKGRRQRKQMIRAGVYGTDIDV